MSLSPERRDSTVARTTATVAVVAVSPYCKFRHKLLHTVERGGVPGRQYVRKGGSWIEFVTMYGTWFGTGQR